MELEARMTRFRPVFVMIGQQADAVLHEAPELPAAAYLRGYLYFFIGNNAAAEKWFDRALKLSRGRSYFSQTFRGAARMRLGKLDAAKKDFDHADELFPNAPITAFWRAALRVLRGDRNGALSILEKLSRHGYIFPEHIRRTPELAPIRKHPRMLQLLKARRSRKRERRSGRP